MIPFPETLSYTLAPIARPKPRNSAYMTAKQRRTAPATMFLEESSREPQRTMNPWWWKVFRGIEDENGGVKDVRVE